MTIFVTSTASSIWEIALVANDTVFRQGSSYQGNRTVTLYLGDLAEGRTKFRTLALDLESEEQICSSEIVFFWIKRAHFQSEDFRNSVSCEFGIKILTPSHGETVVLDEDSAAEIIAEVTGYGRECHVDESGGVAAVADSTVELWDFSSAQKKKTRRLLYNLSFWGEEDGLLHDPTVVLGVVMMISQKYTAEVRLIDPSGAHHSDQVEFDVQGRFFLLLPPFHLLKIDFICKFGRTLCCARISTIFKLLDCVEYRGKSFIYLKF